MTLFGEKWAFREFMLEFFGTNRNYENTIYCKLTIYYSFHRVGLDTTKVIVTI